MVICGLRQMRTEHGMWQNWITRLVRILLVESASTWQLFLDSTERALELY